MIVSGLLITKIFFACFSYVSADGSSRQESGVQKNPGTNLEAYEVNGNYAFNLPNGKNPKLYRVMLSYNRN